MITGNDCCVGICACAEEAFLLLILVIERGTVIGSVTGRVYGPGNCPLESKHVVIGQDINCEDSFTSL